MSLIRIFFDAVFTNNAVLAGAFVSLPFFVIRRKDVRRTGAAVFCIQTVVAAASWWLYNKILMPLGTEYLYVLAFALILALAVQAVWTLGGSGLADSFRDLGGIWGFFAFNGVVLARAFQNAGKGRAFLEDMVDAWGTAFGFLIVLVLMAGIRERLKRTENIPEALRGLPISLISAGLMALAFAGLNGMIR